MIPVLEVAQINLGKDSERIGAQDAERQAATVNHILRAFFGQISDRRELQVLADEVGMGKTYVALSVAYTVLSILRDKDRCQKLDDVSGCYKCVLIITPGGNHTLAEKWTLEVEALLTRCAVDGERTKWFQSILCESADQLLQAIYRAHDLRRRNVPVILVAESGVFTKRLSDQAVRFVTACLFRWWANGLQMRQRYHLIRGLSQTVGSAGWEDAAQWSGRGEYEINLWDWTRHERYLSSSDRERDEWEPRWEKRLFAEVSVTYGDMERALNRFARNGGQEQLEDLRCTCKGAPLKQPGDHRTTDYRAWLEWFRDLKAGLRDVFKRLWPYLLERQFPLVITDEAHHWRNNEAGEFRAIREFIAPFAKRILLLTATPFQLNPQEAISILNVIDHMESAIGKDRAAVLKRMRECLARCMELSERAGRAFSREWGALAEQLARWSPRLSEFDLTRDEQTDSRMESLSRIWGKLDGADLTGSWNIDQVPGPVRPFFNRALELRAANRALGQAMKALVIRHRRSGAHRRYWIGCEYPPNGDASLRPDQSRLHLAPGKSLEPRDELVQYLLMKVVAALSRGRYRTTLGTALTGCYTTMWMSKEGKDAITAASTGEQQGLVDLLSRLTGKATRPKDADHPKLRQVVDAILERWDRGEKSLVFCFRVPTADALVAALKQGIETSLHKKRQALFRARGTEIRTKEDRDKAMQQFRRSLTGRESSGVALFVDRVLAGWLLRLGSQPLALTESDVTAIASLATRAEIKGRPLFPDVERPDRVFLARAIEHIWARRLKMEAVKLETLVGDRRLTGDLLEQMADESWVRDRYGRRDLSTGGDYEGAEITERAARSSLAAHYELQAQPEAARLERLTKDLLSRYTSGRSSVFVSLVDGPNLFAPSRSALTLLGPQGRIDADLVRKAMSGVTLRDGGWNWTARRDSVDALVRALLRDDMLLRMPVSVFKDQDETWASSLFVGLHRPLGAASGAETLAQRLIAFLEEVARMSERERESYLEYAMNPKAEAVALVKGETKSRTSIFSGFNTPLLPEILVCTSVGQEGIDLHRECSHVIHYDLGWNPATIEQRTGRTDRIGSKAERERKLALGVGGKKHEQEMPGLDVALPYLAATYDERMFDVLRTRAQIFEILTGGDPTADREEETHWATTDSEGSDPIDAFVPLPQPMLDDLKVDLSVPIPKGTVKAD
jgi:superfamily II DNA or RNA helicase